MYNFRLLTDNILGTISRHIDGCLCNTGVLYNTVAPGRRFPLVWNVCWSNVLARVGLPGNGQLPRVHLSNSCNTFYSLDDCGSLVGSDMWILGPPRPNLECV